MKRGTRCEDEGRRQREDEADARDLARPQRALGERAEDVALEELVSAEGDAQADERLPALLLREPQREADHQRVQRDARLHEVEGHLAGTVVLVEEALRRQLVRQHHDEEATYQASVRNREVRLLIQHRLRLHEDVQERERKEHARAEALGDVGPLAQVAVGAVLQLRQQHAERAEGRY